jgi:hypothetical protein
MYSPGKLAISQPLCEGFVALYSFFVIASAVKLKGKKLIAFFLEKIA